MKAKSFATQRLDVEPLQVEHAAEMLEGIQDAAIYTYIADDPPASLEWLQRRYSTLIAGSPRNDELWLNWMVRLKATKQACGYVQATVHSEQALIAYVVGDFEANRYRAS